MICPKCGKEMEENKCPFCGFEFSKEDVEKIVEKCDKNLKNNTVKPNVFKTFFTPRGKMGRLDFMKAILVIALIAVVLKILITSIPLNQSSTSPNGLIAVLLIPIGIAILVPVLFAVGKRIADIGWSQWVMLLLFIPYLSLILFLLLFIVPGKQTNQQ